ncbi:MAG: CocE/NonD family hydrolase [Dermatophilaceae bacterium]
MPKSRVCATPARERQRRACRHAPTVCRALAALVVAALVALACGPLGALAAPTAVALSAPQVAEDTQSVPVGPEPDGTPVSLDVTVLSPGSAGVHPAVLLAHGFGGSKADLLGRARDLAARGFVAVAYSARGFGQSGGRIHLDDPAYEVADARRLVDLLATRPDVRLDGPGDPRVGAAGASYGGALVLMAAATDPRIDAVVPAVTWNDLADAFFPQFAVTPGSVARTPGEVDRVADLGPFKALWASRFFGSAASQPTGAASTPQAQATQTTDPVCARFDETVCRLFLAAAETGSPSPELVAMLHAHSPRAVLGAATAPTLLVQGMADTLFGIEQADASARTLSARGVPVAVRWIDGGHDATSTTLDDDEDALRTWLSHYLTGETRPSSDGPLPVPGFVFAAPVPRRATAAPLYAAPAYASPPQVSTLGLAQSPARTVLNPPGGQPSSIVAVPGLPGVAAGAAGYQLAALTGQSAAFDSLPVADRIAVVGAPRLRLTVTSSAAAVTLFVSLWQVTAEAPSLPRRLVAPVTMNLTAGVPTPVDVALAPATWTLEAGSSVRVLVTTTDTTYAGPRQARSDRLELADATLALPTVAATRITGDGEVDLEAAGVAGAVVLMMLVVGICGWLRRRRAGRLPARDDEADVPLVVQGLVKTFADGHRAVDDVSWRADRGQVVGLLGPNGAGKTTTLRMVMGLIRPDAGTVHVLGQPVTAGAPVLRRVGALVEGPGFLPHLTGRQNLHAYWAATGRPDAQAGYEQALEVAALGGAIDRPVRSYSHGMRQRLGIAQAMLGRPEVLVLDEPTNGLDPPQIAAMRPILQRYAATGRTVVISSHLLAEVELTCSHVVVMHAGRVVTSGRVADLLDSSDTTVVTLQAGSDPAATADALRGVAGIRDVEVTGDGSEPTLTVVADLPRAEVVRAATGSGARIDGVSSRRHLEEVFLGVIAQAQHLDAGHAHNLDGSVTDELRQVRAR